VRDDGPGISEEYYETVFLRLYRLGLSRQGGGFGLGLPIVKAIIELHDSAISLSSSQFD
jgi:signal transduction histidine kinase